VVFKRCYKCTETKPADAFYVDNTRKGGRSSRCKDCARIQERGRYRYSTEAKEARKAVTRARRNAPETLARQAAQKKVSRAAYEASPQGREQRAIKDARKRAGLQSASRNFSELDSLVYREMRRHVKDLEELTGQAYNIDHIVPLRHKKACGLHRHSNWQVVPASWNNRKGASNMEVYKR
jgi:hypothetical protein